MKEEKERKRRASNLEEENPYRSSRYRSPGPNEAEFERPTNPYGRDLYNTQTSRSLDGGSTLNRLLRNEDKTSDGPTDASIQRARHLDNFRRTLSDTEGDSGKYF